MPLITLVVDQNEERGKGMSEALSLGSKAYYTNGTYCVLAGTWTQYVSPPESISLVVLHDNNRTEWEHLQDSYGLVAAETVHYTGGTVCGAVDEIWIRQRSISSAKQALSQGEADSILEWLSARKSNPTLALPPILLPPIANGELLVALAVLCQGYLAIHATPLPNNKWGPSEIEKGLTLMGWPKLMESGAGELVSKEFSKQQIEVKRPKWWKSVLAGSKDDVRQKLSNECHGALPTELDELLKEIFVTENSAKETESVQPHTVNDAYIALAECLEKSA